MLCPWRNRGGEKLSKESLHPGDRIPEVAEPRLVDRDSRHIAIAPRPSPSS